MNITKAVYKTSAVDKAGILNDEVPEFAFVGRSNVGKSSLINALVNQKRLAKTSSTAGLTKMVNYFDINDSFRFVDLPGYGFAKVGKGQLDVWASLMGEYLLTSQSLLTVFVLLDIRIKPTELDKAMINYLVYHNIPFRLLATKCDKLSRAQQNKSIEIIAKELNMRKEFIILTSSEKRQGIEKLLNYMEGVLDRLAQSDE